ncbi:hypothetical protein OYC64_003461 [Pagothenia borchgrevinki]|uniref:Uncharacterized protein n=1 Tax=Pagothenia borchgrevinki TaxID=8213 RepID=A0ABD2FPC3_PAGBO
MSDKKTGQINLSTNKKIKKLRTISVVCSLTGSWQQWVTENENKQVGECVSKKPHPVIQPTEALQQYETTSGEAQKTTHKDAKYSSKTEEVNTTAEALSRIKVKPVMKTVTSGIQEKSAGIGLLTESPCHQKRRSTGF